MNSCSTELGPLRLAQGAGGLEFDRAVALLPDVGALRGSRTNSWCRADRTGSAVTCGRRAEGRCVVVGAGPRRGERQRKEEGGRATEGGTARTLVPPFPCVLAAAVGGGLAERPADAQVEGSARPSVRHQHGKRLLAHQVEAHAAEQPLVEPRMAEGAGDDQVRVLGVEAGEKGLDRREVAGVGPVGDVRFPRRAASRCSVSRTAEARRSLGRDEKQNTVTLTAFSRKGMASWTARSASRPPFQAMTTLSPIVPPVQSGRQDQHRRAGRRAPGRARPADHVARRTARSGRDDEIDAMAERVALARPVGRNEHSRKPGRPGLVLERLPGHGPLVRGERAGRGAGVDADQARAMRPGQGDGVLEPLFDSAVGSR